MPIANSAAAAAAAVLSLTSTVPLALAAPLYLAFLTFDLGTTLTFLGRERDSNPVVNFLMDRTRSPLKAVALIPIVWEWPSLLLMTAALSLSLGLPADLPLTFLMLALGGTHALAGAWNLASRRRLP